MRRLGLLFVLVFLATFYAAWPRQVRSHETLTTTVLFDREIVRVLDSRCVMCHAADGPSFPLETYEQTWLRRRGVRDAVIARHMPPWPAVPGYGRFVNDNGLTLRETQFVVSWVEGLGPRNAGTVFTNTAEPGARPAEIRARNLHAGHWHLGEPSMIRSLPAVRIEAEQPASVRRVVVDLGLTSARQVQAMQYMPGDRRVVRAAIFTVQETGQWLGSWTPWYGYMQLPDGAAFLLPAGAHVVADIHYRGARQTVVDEGKLGLTFAEHRSPRAVSDIALTATATAPATAGRQRLRAETRIAADTHVVALRPEMSGDITSIEVAARRSDGGTDILLFARDFDHEWPTPFVLQDPVLVRRGSVLTVTAYAGGAAAKPAVRLIATGIPVP